MLSKALSWFKKVPLKAGYVVVLETAEGRRGFGAATVGDRAYFVAGAHGCGSNMVSKELRVFTRLGRFPNPDPA
jgi:hypothetical protein